MMTHAVHAHWWILGALLLAGFMVPVSEDLMIIAAGVLAATVVPENSVILFICVFLGCYISDGIVYILGRVLGDRLLGLAWFRRALNPQRMARLENFYARFGIWTLLIGRFIPFGVRNALFISAGLGKMGFVRFIFVDALACVISNTTLFLLAFHFGKNYALLLEYVKTYNSAIFVIFLGSIAIFAYYLYRKKAALKKAAAVNIEPEA